MNFDYFDIHSHLDFKDFDSDREQVIADMKEQKVGTISIGVDLKTSQAAVALADKHDHLFAAIGLHPADNLTEVFNKEDYAELVKHPKVVAIGECGLDYFRLEGGDRKTIQKKYFEEQIEFAVEHDKALMIHCRDAYPDCLAILASKQQEYGEKVRGNFHFFTSPIDIAKQCLDIGFTVSFTGPITFTTQYDEVVKYVPLDRMMTETDAPFAAPAPYRGKRNNPLYVKEVVKKIAEIKGLGFDEVRKKMVDNAFQVFLNKS